MMTATGLNLAGMPMIPRFSPSDSHR